MASFGVSIDIKTISESQSNEIIKGTSLKDVEGISLEVIDGQAQRWSKEQARRSSIRIIIVTETTTVWSDEEVHSRAPETLMTGIGYKRSPSRDTDDWNRRQSWQLIYGYTSESMLFLEPRQLSLVFIWFL
ncbi:hypothetical protein TorRG33x02_003110 [Trema orientale]|uniref:Uncharacterized protein n=1 Tax=Trema orientale TaxID=63057 RepID=A0A2P5G1W1_TREOI|nr:hypothetical protein TorRG33x02_003110 [Trema orientale]